jgi:replication factor C subunit 2/4
MSPGAWSILSYSYVYLEPIRRIIEPLASRCSKFRFTPLDSSSTSSRLAHIAAAEHVTINPSAIDTLITASAGDLRRAITYLQSASRLSSSTDPPTEITSQDIQEIAGVVPDSVIEDFAASLGIDVGSRMDIDGPPVKIKMTRFERIRAQVKVLTREGYSATQILSQVIGFLLSVSLPAHRTPQLHDLVVFHPTLNGRQKSPCVLAFAEADKALCDGADEELWILEVGLRVHKAVSA